MTRALMLLIAAAAVSSAAGASPCRDAVNAGYLGVTHSVGSNNCYLQYKTDWDKFSSISKCSNFTSVTGYDAATCDPLVFNFSKCSLQALKLLKPGNTLDDAAFQTLALNNQCSTDPNFAKAYPKCKSSTMKYLNFLRLFVCLKAAVP
ncbi:uncharacterized protein LOC108673163 [Hyalella azteca]|uniref:Uncharacterized protein LOC108673163 n=1 Tax=Hyalella azteca TaxID=294128 RepID=A0A8B7NRX9_HYAAZ|nr:uncharacterized protein LOC108673163 [Hyalella azteca]